MSSWCLLAHCPSAFLNALRWSWHLGDCRPVCTYIHPVWPGALTRCQTQRHAAIYNTNPPNLNHLCLPRTIGNWFQHWRQFLERWARGERGHAQKKLITRFHWSEIKVRSAFCCEEKNGIQETVTKTSESSYRPDLQKYMSVLNPPRRWKRLQYNRDQMTTSDTFISLVQHTWRTTIMQTDIAFLQHQPVYGRTGALFLHTIVPFLNQRGGIGGWPLTP